MKQIYKLILMLLALLPTILVAGTPADLRENPGFKYDFEYPGNYQTAYQSVIEKMRACYSGKPMTKVYGELYTKKPFGEVIVEMGNSLYLRTAILVDLHGVDESNTKITVYAHNKNWAPKANAVEKWLLEDYAKCSFSEPKEYDPDEAFF